MVVKKLQTIKNNFKKNIGVFNSSFIATISLFFPTMKLV